MQSKCAYLDEYRIIKTLGSGYHAKVKLAEAPNHTLVAIKRFKQETANIQTLRHELGIMSKLHHENLVNLIEVREKATYKKKTGVTFECFAIILEYVGGGELFDFIALGGKFSENVTRTYFHSLMNGLHYIHSKGFAHRDIKPENLLLTSDFILKIADFGFSSTLVGKDGTGVLHTKLGTEGYMAPEIQTKNYHGAEIDIFAAGVILFIMYSGSPPFERSIPSDPYYGLIKNKSFQTFWNAHSKRRPPGFYSDDFKDLFQGMVAFIPSERYKIQQIAAHNWVKGKTLTVNDVKDEFTLRKKKVDAEQERQRIEKEKEKQARSGALQNRGAFNRGEEDEEVSSFLEGLEAQEGKFEQLKTKEVAAHGAIVLNEKKEYVLASLLALLSKPLTIEDDVQTLEFGCEYDIKDQEINVSLTNTQEKINVDLRINVSVTPKNHIQLAFNRVSGNQLHYKRLVNVIKSDFLYCQAN